MKRISKEDVMQAAKAYTTNPSTLITIESIIDGIDAPEAEPVVHGIWIYDCVREFHSCSVCGRPAPGHEYQDHDGVMRYTDFTTERCGHCGAIMDAE